MKKALFLAILSGAALLGGCANSNPDLSQAAQVDEKTYTPTGTRIPRRDAGGTTLMDKEQLEQAARAGGALGGSGR